jgi:hypothetical protein
MQAAFPENTEQSFEQGYLHKTIKINPRGVTVSTFREVSKRYTGIM